MATRVLWCEFEETTSDFVDPVWDNESWAINVHDPDTYAIPLFTVYSSAPGAWAVQAPVGAAIEVEVPMDYRDYRLAIEYRTPKETVWNGYSRRRYTATYTPAVAINYGWTIPGAIPATTIEVWTEVQVSDGTEISQVEWWLLQPIAYEVGGIPVFEEGPIDGVLHDVLGTGLSLEIPSPSGLRRWIMPVVTDTWGRRNPIEIARYFAVGFLADNPRVDFTIERNPSDDYRLQVDVAGTATDRDGIAYVAYSLAPLHGLGSTDTLSGLEGTLEAELEGEYEITLTVRDAHPTYGALTQVQHKHPVTLTRPPWAAAAWDASGGLLVARKNEGSGRGRYFRQGWASRSFWMGAGGVADVTCLPGDIFAAVGVGSYNLNAPDDWAVTLSSDYGRTWGQMPAPFTNVTPPAGMVAGDLVGCGIATLGEGGIAVLARQMNTSPMKLWLFLSRDLYHWTVISAGQLPAANSAQTLAIASDAIAGGSRLVITNGHDLMKVTTDYGTTWEDY